MVKRILNNIGALINMVSLFGIYLSGQDHHQINLILYSSLPLVLFVKLYAFSLET